MNLVACIAIFWLKFVLDIIIHYVNGWEPQVRVVLDDINLWF